MRYSNVQPTTEPEVGDVVEITGVDGKVTFADYEVINVYKNGLLITKGGSNDNTHVVDFDDVKSIEYCRRWA